MQYVLQQEIPTILAGDFNISETCQVFGNLYENLYKPVVENKKTTLKRKCNGTQYLNHSIDNIYVPSKSVEIVSSGTIDFVRNCQPIQEARKISDHIPVFVNFIVSK